VAVARLGLVAGGWAGLYGVWVDPEHRGRGLARALTGALAVRAVARGTRSVYLQTLHANEPAVGLYSSLGFSPHHGYAYLDR
jgi:ribosomal protein S18 acetylase RimI-like enzyme